MFTNRQGRTYSGSYPYATRIIKSALSLLLVLALAVVSTSCGSSTAFTSEEIKSMQAAIDAEMQANAIPGAVVGVWVPGRGSWVTTSGVANLETGEPMSQDCGFRIASIAKTFVSTVVLQLFDEGKIELDDPFSKFIQGVPNTDGVTVRMLLNHTSGLYDFLEDENFDIRTSADRTRTWQPQELVDIASTHQPYFPPGSGWHYSNTNYVLLGMLVEKVTGKSIVEEISDRIAKPLGLQNTSFTQGTDIPGKHSQGYADVDGDSDLENVTVLNPSMGWASSAMTSNLRDLKIWAKALADRQLLGEKAKKERFTWINTQPGTDLRYYDLGVEKLFGWLGHTGAAFGFNCSMYHLPSKDATVVVLLNETPPGFDSSDKIFSNIVSTLFP